MIKITAMTCMCVDLFVETDTVVVGGEALNFAANAGEYDDVSVSLLGPIGDDRFADAVMDFVKNRNIGIENIHVLSGRTATHKIHISPEGDRYFKEGAWDGGVQDTFRLTKEDEEHLAGQDVWFITYSSPNFMEVLELKKKGAKALLAVDFDVLRDFSGLGGILPYIDFFMISGEESILPLFEEMSRAYDCMFNVTLAERGSVTYHRGETYRVNAVPVEKVVDTTGCGDSYHAGFLCSYLSFLFSKGLLCLFQGLLCFIKCRL